ncbi:Glycerate kinase [Chloroherpeton thalassium ATCC 35110]|uniref:Glycerate kinase n=1 Tax=Chloroherpeton thalassium (strain ATCC 35110 / GB-78) TaxID=517418 RepID=B3QYP9_CHLT3|nr:glycerate kinase [Chloroherpeton thalassium]ACF15122.1 Glycerate kinase [Chloroherpeton thalassium ATCC 35110]
MVQILIAPDSFKGTFSALQIALLIESCIPNGEVHKTLLQPLADGGEGTLEILAAAYNAKTVSAQVTGPFGNQVEAKYAVSDSLALLEMAEASGLCHAKNGILKPEIATTYGTGELITKVAHEGFQKIILGLGGSATVDGGAGALQALGAVLTNKQGKTISFGNQGLGDLEHAHFENAISNLTKSCLILATDVTNPLLGENGAVYVYGKQKGVREEDLPAFESRMRRFAECVERAQQESFRNKPGSGAAGGLAFGLMAIGGEVASGFQLIAEHVRLEEKIQYADLVITGEGKFDRSSLCGKVTGSVIQLCAKYQKPCYVICGTAETVSPEMLAPDVKIVPLFSHQNIGAADLKTETANRLKSIIATLMKAAFKS